VDYALHARRQLPVLLMVGANDDAERFEELSKNLPKRHPREPIGSLRH